MDQACLHVCAGLLPLIDEECGLRNGTDDNLLRKVIEHHKVASVLRHAGPRRPDAFAITHYAGEVAYDIAGFVDRNRDRLSHDVLSLMCCSTEGWLKATFQGKVAAAQKLARGAKRKETLVAQFRSSLASLMSEIGAGGAHFMRCVKSNDAQATCPACTQQLR